jgi:hypothetical protein
MTVSRRSQSQQRRSRWSGFLGDVQNESVTFKEILRESAARKEQSNQDYRTFAQLSFNAIHNVVRKKPDPSRMTPNRYSRLQGFHPPPSQISEPPVTPFEFDTRVANHNRWPERPVTRNSLRVLNPVRLRDYSGMARHKDVPCILGAQVSDVTELL